MRLQSVEMAGVRIAGIALVLDEKEGKAKKCLKIQPQKSPSLS